MSRRKKHTPRAIEKALIHSVNAADHLSDLYGAGVRAVRELAQRLDDLSIAVDSNPTLIKDPNAAAQVVSKTAYGLQIYMSALRELNMTPGSGGVGDDAADGADPREEFDALIAASFDAAGTADAADSDTPPA